MLSYAHRRKTVGWVATLAATIVLTTGFDIPINVGSMTEWQPRTAHTVGVTKRCNQQNEVTGRTKSAGAQANSEKHRTGLLRLFL